MTTPKLPMRECPAGYVEPLPEIPDACYGPDAVPLPALDDEPTIAQVLAMLDDDVVPLLDSTAGALVTRRDRTDTDREDEREALEIASDLLAQAWANVRRAAEIIRADVPTTARVAPRLRVTRIRTLWYVVDESGVYLAFAHTQSEAMDRARGIAVRFAA